MIEVKQIEKRFPVGESLLGTLLSFFTGKKNFVRAVNGVSFNMQRGEILGLAGESGCGKTSTAMMLLGLYQPTRGVILFEGKDINALRGNALAEFRRSAQLVFQDPYGSLNPRFTIRRTIEESLIVNKVRGKDARNKRIITAMQRANLYPLEAFFNKYPHELSGGERQRVCIARAIVLEPALLVADEAVSMLDVSIRASILNLLRNLTKEMKMATLYISHDLSLLGNMCDHIAIMYAGEIVETGRPEVIIDSPRHPYTKALIAAVPVPEFKARKSPPALLKGEPPDLTDFSETCRFLSRCDFREECCNSQKPQLREVEAGHFVSCNRIGE